jgi:ankyrin repeat protein
VKYLDSNMKMESMNHLDFAIRNDQPKIVEFFISKGAAIESKQLHFACTHGKLEMVRFFVRDLKLDVRESDFNAFHLASGNGHLDVVQFLAEAGTVVTSCTNICGFTALHLASYYGHLNVVRYLVDRQCLNVNADTRKDLRHGGLTALHFAVRNGYVDIVRYLAVQGRADIDQLTKDNVTAWMIAKKMGNLAMVELLRELGAKVSVPDVAVNDVVWNGMWRIDETLKLMDTCKTIKVHRRGNSSEYKRICGCRFT